MIWRQNCPGEPKQERNEKSKIIKFKWIKSDNIFDLSVKVFSRRRLLFVWRRRIFFLLKIKALITPPSVNYFWFSNQARLSFCVPRNTFHVIITLQKNRTIGVSLNWNSSPFCKPRLFRERKKERKKIVVMNGGATKQLRRQPYGDSSPAAHQSSSVSLSPWSDSLFSARCTTPLWLSSRSQRWHRMTLLIIVEWFHPKLQAEASGSRSDDEH